MSVDHSDLFHGPVILPFFLEGLCYRRMLQCEMIYLQIPQSAVAGFSRQARLSSDSSYLNHVMRKPVLPYANSKGADQPVHPCSLIRAFVIRCLDSIISVVSICNLKPLANLCS